MTKERTLNFTPYAVVFSSALYVLYLVLWRRLTLETLASFSLLTAYSGYAIATACVVPAFFFGFSGPAYRPSAILYPHHPDDGIPSAVVRSAPKNDIERAYLPGSSVEEETDAASSIPPPAHGGILEISPAGLIVFANETALALFACERRDLIGRNFFDVIGSVTEEQHFSPPPQYALRRALKGDARKSLDIVWTQGKTENRLPVRVTLFPLFRHGSRNGALMSITDIPAAHDAELSVETLCSKGREGRVIFSDTLKPLACNSVFLDLLGGAAKEDVLSDFFRYSPEFQHEGKPDSASLSVFVRAHRDAILNGRAKLPWTHLDGEGSPVNCQVALWPIRMDARSFFIADVRKITTAEWAARNTPDHTRTSNLQREFHRSSRRSGFGGNASRRIAPRSAQLKSTNI